jgi:hypothetical protein
VTVGWQYHDFVRLACVAPTRAAALEALRVRIDKLREAGYAIPTDSLVTVRSTPGATDVLGPSSGVASAELTLPEHLRSESGSFVLRRWVNEPKRRTISGTQPRFIFPELDDEKAG